MEKLILVCEDDRPILEVTKTILETEGMRVIGLLDCEDIVMKAIEFKPDLILMDVWLPETGGEEATCILKKDPRTRDIPVVLFSAVNHLDQIAKRCGANGIVRKPFELKELTNTIRMHLGLPRAMASA